jgi:RNA polymerase subunit RPABC4/transcription elongation factor Spt4
LLDQVQGFCPNCGKIIQEQFSDKCPKCNQEYDSRTLLKDIDKAHEASKSYKEFILETEIECPNEQCKRIIQSSWEECPYCHTIF